MLFRSILKQTQLTEDDYRIICADNPKNRKTLEGVLNGSRMGKELSANALQEHFTLPYAGQPPIPLSIPVDAADKAHGQTAYDSEDISGGMGLLTPEGPAVDAEEKAFIRAMKRKKKKKRKGLGL